MAVSARMQALIQKIEAADAAHFAALREKGKAQADARAKAREKDVGEEARKSPRGAGRPSKGCSKEEGEQPTHR